uniref:LAGLIDADG homing endonuclease n=1 Tax=Romanomermis culicivorax TaxID=13658 RepID=A0A915HM22_ROMCU
MIVLAQQCSVKSTGDTSTLSTIRSTFGQCSRVLVKKGFVTPTTILGLKNNRHLFSFNLKFKELKAIIEQAFINEAVFVNWQRKFYQRKEGKLIRPLFIALFEKMEEGSKFKVEVGK